MITVDGTISLCGDLNSDPADVVWLAVAYELKSPSMGAWSRKGWTDGLKRLGCVFPLPLPHGIERADGRRGGAALTTSRGCRAC